MQASTFSSEYTLATVDHRAFLGAAAVSGVPCVAKILQEAIPGSANLVVSISGGRPLRTVLQARVQAKQGVPPVSHSVSGNVTSFTISATAQQLDAVGWPRAPQPVVLGAGLAETAVGGGSAAVTGAMGAGDAVATGTAVPLAGGLLPEGATDGNLVRSDERAPLPVGAQRAADPVLRGDVGAGAGIGLGAAQAAGANPHGALDAAVTSLLAFSALSPSTPLPTVGEALLYKQYNGQVVEVRVEAVHTDVDPPFFDIRVRSAVGDGWRQTELHRLSRYPLAPVGGEGLGAGDADAHAVANAPAVAVPAALLPPAAQAPAVGAVAAGQPVQHVDLVGALAAGVTAARRCPALTGLSKQFVHMSAGALAVCTVRLGTFVPGNAESADIFAVSVVDGDAPHGFSGTMLRGEVSLLDDIVAPSSDGPYTGRVISVLAIPGGPTFKDVLLKKLGEDGCYDVECSTPGVPRLASSFVLSLERAQQLAPSLEPALSMGALAGAPPPGGLPGAAHPSAPLPMGASGAPAARSPFSPPDTAAAPAVAALLQAGRGLPGLLGGGTAGTLTGAGSAEVTDAQFMALAGLGSHAELTNDVAFATELLGSMPPGDITVQSLDEFLDVLYSPKPVPAIARFPATAVFPRLAAIDRELKARVKGDKSELTKRTCTSWMEVSLTLSELGEPATASASSQLSGSGGESALARFALAVGQSRTQPAKEPDAGTPAHHVWQTQQEVNAKAAAAALLLAQQGAAGALSVAAAKLAPTAGAVEAAQNKADATLGEVAGPVGVLASGFASLGGSADLAPLARLSDVALKDIGADAAHGTHAGIALAHIGASRSTLLRGSAEVYVRKYESGLAGKPERVTRLESVRSTADVLMKGQLLKLKPYDLMGSKNGVTSSMSLSDFLQKCSPTVIREYLEDLGHLFAIVQPCSQSETCFFTALRQRVKDCQENHGVSASDAAAFVKAVCKTFDDQVVRFRTGTLLLRPRLTSDWLDGGAVTPLERQLKLRGEFTAAKAAVDADTKAAAAAVVAAPAQAYAAAPMAAHMPPPPWWAFQQPPPWAYPGVQAMPPAPYMPPPPNPTVPLVAAQPAKGAKGEKKDKPKGGKGGKGDKASVTFQLTPDAPYTHPVLGTAVDLDANTVAVNGNFAKPASGFPAKPAIDALSQWGQANLDSNGRRKCWDYHSHGVCIKPTALKCAYSHAE
jgi:hypothetical protein